VAAQIVYYVTAAVALGAPDRRLAFAVPTGNFGNVYAAYGARAMGVPIERLVVGTNSNDILARFFASGRMEAATVVPTISPSMDIQISSNFERLLFDLVDRDGAAVADAMATFRKTGAFAVTQAQLGRATALFEGHRCSEADTRATMERVWRETGELIDPHTAVGVHAASESLLPREVPLVALACAHPAKFPDAVEKATGVRPPLPERLSDLLTREERVSVLPNDIEAVKKFVRRAGARS
jgi:threonine synthase